MKKVAVIHTAFEKTPRTVAFIDVPEFAKIDETLEYAFRWTQNIRDSWSLKGEQDGNDKVTVVGELVNGKGLRSTSVGDQILVGTKKYTVAPMGFEEMVT